MSIYRRYGVRDDVDVDAVPIAPTDAANTILGKGTETNRSIRRSGADYSSRYCLNIVIG